MLARATQQARRAANLSRFFSPVLAERLAATEPAGATGDRRPVAILFVNMRGAAGSTGLKSASRKSCALGATLALFKKLSSSGGFRYGYEKGADRRCFAPKENGRVLVDREIVGLRQGRGSAE
jgi:hypothetical protein